MDFGTLIEILKVTAIIGYLVAALLLFKHQKTGLIIAGVGWIANVGIMVVSWLGMGEPPFGNMYYVLVFIASCFIPLHFLISWKEKIKWLLPYFLVAASVSMAGSFFMKSQAVWRRSPALQSIWFIPHVTSYSISYALFAIAVALVVIALIRKRRNHNDQTKYESASYQLVRLAFPFMTFGLLLGALWAEEAWGVYWSWDPKETWSLITWTLYLVYFHALRHKELRKWANTIQILAFIALLMTFIGVNLLPSLGSILHSYT